jgi:hypothetical protein
VQPDVLMLAGFDTGILKSEESPTGSKSDAIRSPGPSVAAHLLEACRVAMATAPVGLGVLAGRERVRAAPLTFDPVVVVGAI